MATRVRRPRATLPFPSPEAEPLTSGWLTWVVQDEPIRFLWERYRVGSGGLARPDRLIDVLRPGDVYVDPLRPDEVVIRQLVSLRTGSVIPTASAEELAEALRDPSGCGWARAK